MTASSESVAAAANASATLKCEQCNKTFKKKSNLLFHVEKVHQTVALPKSSGRGKSSQQQQVSCCTVANRFMLKMQDYKCKSSLNR